LKRCSMIEMCWNKYYYYYYYYGSKDTRG